MNPIRIYVYKEGLVRILAEKYNLTLDILDIPEMHFTNFHLSRNSTKFKFVEDENSQEGNLWSFTTLKKFFKKLNVNFDII